MRQIRKEWLSFKPFKRYSTYMIVSLRRVAYTIVYALCTREPNWHPWKYIIRCWADELEKSALNILHNRRHSNCDSWMTAMLINSSINESNAMLRILFRENHNYDLIHFIQIPWQQKETLKETYKWKTIYINNTKWKGLLNKHETQHLCKRELYSYF